MDKADIANDYIEWRLEQAMKARQQCAASVLSSRAICKKCDEPIPAARRKALPGVQLCVECQSAMEGR
ncbi:TraR/DksA family transcriptional regulator [Vreelandella titanicae]|uniref:TraR/DksA family transcriptional regulator n=1 Tax=Vreelandella titanicae TaxID=664683 RepID=UPI00241D7F33|nr:TraR/DksA family transcriptional regulator [Halomonas titanicae]